MEDLKKLLDFYLPIEEYYNLIYTLRYLTDLIGFDEAYSIWLVYSYMVLDTKEKRLAYTQHRKIFGW